MATIGAVGAVAADKYEPSKFRAGMNLQFGMVAARPEDVFLMASDGLWDTLDPVQVTLLEQANRCIGSFSFGREVLNCRVATSTCVA